jgi:hypothetical protein
MTHYNLTRWIEIADARHACEAAMLDRVPQLSESPYLHLGAIIAKVPFRNFTSLPGSAMKAAATHALAQVRQIRLRTTAALAAVPAILFCARATEIKGDRRQAVQRINKPLVSCSDSELKQAERVISGLLGN